MREIKFRGKHDGKWLHGYLDCNFNLIRQKSSTS